MNLLIVDDEWYAVKGISLGIDWEGSGVSRVYEALSVGEARAILEEAEISVILCDIEMPGADGLEFAGQLMETHPRIPVIFLTGHSNFSYAQRALQANAFDYVLKPVDHGLLRDRVKAALEHARAEEERHSFAARWRDYAARLGRERPEQIRLFWRSVVENRLGREAIYARIRALELPLEDPASITPVAVWIDGYRGEPSARDEEMAPFVLGEQLEEALFPEGGGCWLREEGMDSLLLFYRRPRELEDLLRREAGRIGARMLCSLRWRIGESAAPEGLWWALYRMKASLSARKELPLEAQAMDWEVLFARRSPAQLHAQADYLLALAAEHPPEFTRSLYHKFSGALYALSAQYGFSRITMELLEGMGPDGGAERTGRWMHQMIEAAIRDSNTGIPSGNSAVEAVSRYIRANLEYPLSLEDMAAQVHLHPGYLSRLFKQETGVSVSDFVTARRMELAKALLKDPGIKISSVAARAGYQQTAYFSRVFHREVGVSPLEFQRGMGKRQG